jgi:hypothetical protein
MSVSPRALVRMAITALVIAAVVIVWLSILFPRYWLFDLDAPPARPALQERGVRDES